MDFEVGSAPRGNGNRKKNILKTNNSLKMFGRFFNNSRKIKNRIQTIHEFKQ